MELQPKLVAAADMCESGEEVNLDELAFLLRYASDELGGVEKLKAERDHLLERMRGRVLARCDLLGSGVRDLERARKGDLAELEELDDDLDRRLRERFPEGNPSSPSRADTSARDYGRFRSGR